MNEPKFQIGDKVMALVETHGHYEPSVCRKGEIVEIDTVSREDDGFHYICTINGYEFHEDQLMKVSKKQQQALEKGVNK